MLLYLDLASCLNIRILVQPEDEACLNSTESTILGVMFNGIE